VCDLLSWVVFHVKPRLCVITHAVDPFLIGREVIWQSFDWPCENPWRSREGVWETGLKHLGRHVGILAIKVKLVPDLQAEGLESRV
jgi:hypothetical protein